MVLLLVIKAFDPLELRVMYGVIVEPRISRNTKFGMVVRDARGEVRLCAVSREDNINSAMHAELFKVILFGLEVTQNNFSEPLIVESDSLLVITEISKKNDSLCEWDGIISDILKLSLEGGSCRFNHIRRFTNVLAHNIVCLYCETGDHLIWRELFFMIY